MIDLCKSGSFWSLTGMVGGSLQILGIRKSFSFAGSGSRLGGGESRILCSAPSSSGSDDSIVSREGGCAGSESLIG